MSSALRKIIELIEQITDVHVARQISEDCAGRKVNLRIRALLADQHPFRRTLDPGAMAELIDALRESPHLGDRIRFPVTAETAHLRACRERAAHIRSLIAAGLGSGDIARAARVSVRTVLNHRARMRREGLLHAEARP